VTDIFSLAGKTALVAGASRGIGLAIAQGLADAGANTILAARSVDKLEAHAADIRKKGQSASALKLDVADSKSIQEAAGAAGNVDILINVAGMNIRKRFQDYTRDEYDRMLQTNLTGLVELTQKVGAKMIERGAGGKIVMIGSLMSMVGLPYLTVYGITKGALGQLTKNLASEWGRHRIQVNCIAPGFIVTDLNREMWKRPDLNEWKKGVQASIDFGTPEDVAALAVFLSGRGSNYITGQIIPVDGGYTTTAVWPFEP
jgi:NAD(P)-dependent dehydrogenase (short-subunit alcohol dehydrogenase family)